MRRAFVAALGLISAAGSDAFADDLGSDGSILQCDFAAVEEAGQPARHIEVRPEPWDDARDPLDLFGDGEPVYLWIEEGLSECPVWPPKFIHDIGGLGVQRWGCDDEMRMLTFGNKDGRALLSVHAVEGDPPQLVAFTAPGTCALVEEE